MSIESLLYVCIFSSIGLDVPHHGKELLEVDFSVSVGVNLVHNCLELLVLNLVLELFSLKQGLDLPRINLA